jgi:glycosyltransferase involved in cell wall biosynthesis
LLHVFASFGLGGVPIRIATMVNHFGERYRHSIIAVDRCYDCRERLDPAIVTQYPESDDQHRALPGRVLAIRRQLRAENPDLLLTYNWGAIEWALASRFVGDCPHVHFESGFGPDEADRQLRRRVLFRRAALGGRSPVVVPSRTLLDIALGDWRLASDQVLYVPNGVDTARFAIARDESLRRTLVPESDALIVGTLAPLRAEKNIGRLLRAFMAADTPAGSRLVIFGDGRERNALESYAGELGLADSVTFAGHTDEIENALSTFDVFAMSSDTEQMPNSLLQAMAAGLPVAAVDVGDIAHLVSQENRPFVVPRSDESRLAAALTRLLGDRDTRAAIGQRNQAHVAEHYSIERMRNAYEALFERRL